MPRRRVIPLAAALAVLTLTSACSPQASPTFGVPTLAPTPTPVTSGSPPGSPVAVSSPAPSPGYFAFDAESILGYYATLGYTCDAGQPSVHAAGYLYRSCQLLDDEGRTRVVGIVTDPANEMGGAFTSITGMSSEVFLNPQTALEPFSAFLGAVLGEAQGESMLEWLASHLGDEFATTTLGDLTIATYTESKTDRSRLYLEIANDAYLESPSPQP